MKRPVLIVNADDYAMNEAMSAAIRAAFSDDLISSASCFATSPSFKEEIQRAIKAGLTTFGVHLDLSFGMPVSPTVGQSRFPENSAKELTKDQIKTEFAAQIQRVLDSGIQISHLDNHRDELYWELQKFEAVYELARQFSLPVRNPLGKNTSELARKLFHDPEKIKLVEKISQEHEKLRKKHKIKTTDYFYSLEHYRDEPTEKIKQIGELLKIQKDSIELCVHLTHELLGLTTERQFLSESDRYKEMLKRHRGKFSDV